MTLTDAQARAARTFAAVLTAVAISAAPIVAVVGVPATTYAAVAAALTGMATMITAVVNALEDHGTISPLLGKNDDP